MRLLFLLSFVFRLFSCSTAQENEAEQSRNPLKLWYNKPADVWEEALPIGNGRLGAMVFGGTDKEIIQLNEETLWAGEPGNNVQPDFKKGIVEIQELIFQGKHQEAQQKANAYFPKGGGSSNNYGMYYQPVGDLRITFVGGSEVTDYYRDLDISNAISKVRYKVDGTSFQRKILSSYTDNVIVMEITADKPAAVSCTLSVNELHQQQKINTTDNALWLTGNGNDHENKKGKLKYTAIFKPKVTGGELNVTDSSLVISNADKLVIFISIATNFNTYNDISGNDSLKALSLLNKAYKKEYSSLEHDHVASYKKYFDRVSLDLGTTDSIYKPTNVRLEEFNRGNDPQLVSLYYQFGRYLLISSSQPNTQPANLQGIWNHKQRPPWDSKYTVNINTEMNYWLAEPTNLSELHEPLFNLIDDISVTGKESATQMYGARGWNIHHNTDLWRISGVVDGGFHGLWPMGGAWLSQHLWYRYLYTGDKAFLKEKYDVLKGASLFCKDLLIEEPQSHWLIISPSMSPENGHQRKTSIAGGTTMDNQLIFDVFSNLIEAANILGIDKDYADSLKNLRERLVPMQIGRWGQLQEWMHDWDKQGSKHRHVSHLYGAFPSNQISPYRTPELMSAAKTSLLARGDASTGWSMGWKVNLWARFLDGDHALKLITDQLKPAIQSDGKHKGGTYPNLFDAHPPFQIDGNFGCVSGITEMLMQSHDGAIHLLPALPNSWKNGKISGVRARGGFEIISLKWLNGKVAEVTIKSHLGGNCRIRSYDKLITKSGQALTKTHGENPNAFYLVPKIKTALISAETKGKTFKVKPTNLYDIKTTAGEEFTLILK